MKASDCSSPEHSLRENERGVFSAAAAAAAARSSDSASLIKLQLLTFMPPVRLQFESTSRLGLMAGSHCATSEVEVDFTQCFADFRCTTMSPYLYHQHKPLLQSLDPDQTLATVSLDARLLVERGKPFEKRLDAKSDDN